RPGQAVQRDVHHHGERQSGAAVRVDHETMLLAWGWPKLRRRSVVFQNPMTRPGRLHASILDTIGATPLVRCPRLAAEEGLKAELCLKLEFFNPGASVKDRIGLAMVRAAEASGRLSPGASLVEPTSGNTGIAL